MKMIKNKPLGKKQRKELANKLEKQLFKLVDRIYDLNVGGRRLTPLHPYVLVRVLPKEHITAGGIVLPEHQQNKPLYEGIVITTWAPYEEERIIVDEFGNDVVTTIVHRSDLHPGERVAFPHFEGLPMFGYLDDMYYRVIREGNDQNKFPYCSVLGKIDYSGDVEILKQLQVLTSKLGSVTTSGLALSRGDTPPVINTPA